MSKKTILVLGATGSQGGSVSRHLLEDGGFQVRCFTRNPNSEAATILRKRGAEIVQGDLSQTESIRKALEGVWGVFGVTNYWEHFEKEEIRGRNLIEAVRNSAVSFFVFSSLPSAAEISGGSLTVSHFDIKARLEKEIRTLGLPCCFVHVAFYYENFLTFPPQPQDDGSFAFASPQGETPLAAVAVEDIGGVVREIFREPIPFDGQTVGIVGSDLKCSEYAEILSEILGRPVYYHYMPREDYAKLGFKGADDLANMFEFYRMYVPSRAAEMARSRQLYPSLQSFPEWVRNNRTKLLEVLDKQVQKT
ncbi:MAG TPA: NmrA/HSCARG family protein [Acidobacteriota bacterium]|nr:NmrA/HSCARG family protein [Acidobacteriota bacterium]